MTDSPAYPQPVSPQPYGAQPAVPGKTLGIVALIVSFFVAVVGLVLGIIALVQSKNVGAKNGPALAAIILSIVFMAVWIGIIALVFGSLFGACADLGNGVHEVDGVTYTCNL